MNRPEPPDDSKEKREGPARRANEDEASQSVEAPNDVASTKTKSQPATDEPNLKVYADEAPEPLEPEDLTSFALNEDFHSGVAKKVLTTVQVKKPAKESFVRTQPDPKAWQVYPILELKEEGKTYLLSPPVAATLETEGETTLVLARLVPTVDRRGNFFLWILKTSNRESDWHVSAYRAAEIAKDRWVRVQANMSAGAYDTCVAENQDAQPQWPDEDLATVLRIAFEGRVITFGDHVVLKGLRGEF